MSNQANDTENQAHEENFPIKIETSDLTENTSNKSPEIVDSGNEHKTNSEKASPNDLSIISTDSVTIIKHKDTIQKEAATDSKQEEKLKLKEDKIEKKPTSTRPIQSNPLSLNEEKQPIENQDPPESTSNNSVLQLETQQVAPASQIFIPLIPQQVEFLPIIDVIAEYQRGNFFPILQCLKLGNVPKDFVDQSGYNILHHAVSYNMVEIVLILLDIFKFDINIRSKTNQTPLMIAANFGFNEIIKILCDHGCDINAQDDTKFTALLYTIKQGMLNSTIYLLYKNANTTLADSNGCTLLHWAAYKNNLFMIRLLKRFGFDLWVIDIQGFNPFERALSSDATEICKFFIEESKKYPTKNKLEDISNLCIRELLRQKFFQTTSEKRIAKAVNFFKGHSKIITFGIYAFAWLMMMIVYIKCTTTNGFDYIYNLIFTIFSLYFIGYSGWYYMSSEKTISKVRQIAYRKIKTKDDSENSMINQEILKTTDIDIDERIKFMNFSALNRLIKEQDHEGITFGDEKHSLTLPTFLHELSYKYEIGSFQEVNLFDPKAYCPTCLKARTQKSKHCSKCNACVDLYQFHSHSLGKCIEKSNHLFYLLLLFQQVFLLLLFVIPPIIIHNSDRNSGPLFFFLETAWVIMIKHGIFYAFWFLLSGAFLLYSLCFLGIEVYGIMYNMTYNEIFNRQRYKYLYKVKVDKRGAVINVFSNPNHKGIFKNIKEYVKRNIF